MAAKPKRVPLKSFQDSTVLIPRFVVVRGFVHAIMSYGKDPLDLSRTTPVLNRGEHGDFTVGWVGDDHGLIYHRYQERVYPIYIPPQMWAWVSKGTFTLEPVFGYSLLWDDDAMRAVAAQFNTAWTDNIVHCLREQLPASTLDRIALGCIEGVV